MKVSGFMTPVEKVVTALPEDSVHRVMDLMLENNIGAVVVVKYEYKYVNDDFDKATLFTRPLGIITKSDLLLAYHEPEVNIHHPCRVIMSDHLATCSPDMDRDEAAAILEENKNHHAVVVDEIGYFKGLISTWDITAEVARDHRAWPWIRSPDGKFHDPHHHHEKKAECEHHPENPPETHTNRGENDGGNAPPPVESRDRQQDGSFRADMGHAGVFHSVL